jgi:hypothetical protein
MTKVGKSDCEGTFAGMRRDDEDAPKAAIRILRIEMVSHPKAAVRCA